jgi:hypothetical protein
LLYRRGSLVALFSRREAGNEPSVRFAVCVVACWACLGLAACGGGDEAGTPATTAAKTIPAPQYARRADELCAQVVSKVLDARIQQRLNLIEQSNALEAEKLERATPILAEQLRMISEFRREIEQLGTPSAHRDDAELLIEKTRSAEEELEKAVASAREGDSEKAREAIARYAGFSAQSASIARDSELNFAICGSGT